MDVKGPNVYVQFPHWGGVIVCRLYVDLSWEAVEYLTPITPNQMQVYGFRMGETYIGV